MRKIGIKHLNLIITENCNLLCSHCLRGEGSNNSMSREMFDLIFSNFSVIDGLNISGGEPFIDYNVFKDLVDSIIENNVTINKFGVVTNGTFYNEKILNELLRLDSVTSHREGTSIITSCISGVEKSKLVPSSTFAKNGIDISFDKYHLEELERLSLTNLRDNNYKLFDKWCLKHCFEFNKHKINEKRLLDSGRAQNLDVEKVLHHRAKLYNWYLETGDMAYLIKLGDFTNNMNYDVDFYLGELNIDVNGEVSLVSEGSFDDMKKYSIGNVCNESIFSILDKKTKEEIAFLLDRVDNRDYSYVDLFGKSYVKIVKNMRK